MDAPVEREGPHPDPREPRPRRLGTPLANPLGLMRRAPWHTPLTSVAVGALATLVDLVALGVAVEQLGVDPRIANVPALLLGLLVQFFGNKFWAFQDHSRAWLRQGGAFVLVEAGALLLSATLFHLVIGTGLLPYLPARLLVQAVVYLSFSMPLWKRIFREGSTS